jgi:hypothetical protein
MRLNYKRSIFMNTKKIFRIAILLSVIGVCSLFAQSKPTYYYSISTGTFSSSPSASWPSCYSGGGAASVRPFMQQHKNNPASTDISDYGPIPPGTWLIVGWDNSKGAYTIRLRPANDYVTHRFGFLIHGDNRSTVGQSSDGCIIMNGDTYRKRIADAYDMYGQLTLIVSR